jgi:hypothetical protein
MKKAIHITGLLLIAFAFNTAAQSTSPKTQEILKQLKQKTGFFTATANGKKVTGKAILIKLANNKGFLITNEMIESKGVQTLTLKLPKPAAGKYPLEKNNNMVTLEGITYEMKEGEISVQVTAGKISGTFSGNIYSVNKSKSKFDVPAGKVNGSFTGLAKP